MNRESKPELKGDSSSSILQEETVLGDGISFGGSAATENVKKLIKAAFENYAMFGNESAGATGYIPPEIHIKLSFQNIGRVLEVSTIKSMNQLILAVNEKFAVAVPIKSIYCLDTQTCQAFTVTQVSDLQAGVTYHCLSSFEVLPIAKPDPIPIVKVEQ